MLRKAAMLVALGFSAGAQAEVLPIISGEPASAAEVAMMHGVAVDQFSGSDGRALAAAFERQLARATDRAGADYFAIYSLQSPGAADRVEVVFEGGASASVEERRTQQKRRYCKDAEKPRTDCEDKVKEEREVTCRQRVIALTSDLRAARELDGRIIYSRALPRRDEVTWCPADAAPPASEDVISRMIGDVAADFADDFTPLWQNQAVRVLESRKGLSKDQGNRFKAALKATKTDAGEACRLFDDLAAEAASQRSLAYNAALCAEMRGDWETALARFEAMAGDRDANAAARRVQGTMAALALEEERSRRRSE
ncbi:hypothetical protein U4960_12480 [Altererythrobacter sp. H2]|uniref:hypothetical protein n=1 Tax=Altererythrobacter sp. H2 TaxID=3108391 RepID=UPI002B4BA7C7|nr:hypothetical protein [Altererythrobacter sp. H2]WRK95099.1 hypothetical protein U4960_12480 [Altererythrobacter sp. H2]